MSLLSLFDQFNASFLSFTKTLMANVELQRFLSNQMLSNVLSLEKNGQTLFAFIRLHAASKLTVLVRNISTEVFHRAVKVKPLLQKALHSISISTVRYMCCFMFWHMHQLFTSLQLNCLSSVTESPVFESKAWRRRSLLSSTPQTLSPPRPSCLCPSHSSTSAPWTCQRKKLWTC